MAGEDPGVSTISVLLDVIQRAWAAVTGSAKAVVSGIVGVAKTWFFFSMRKHMMQDAHGPELAHGKQSLSKLRRHEERGANLISVEIGDRKAMKALDKELKRSKIDYAITGNRSRGYALHYKSVNEKDVLAAQARALENLYGNPKNTHEERETPKDPNPKDEQKHDEHDSHDQNRSDEEREQQNRDQRNRERTDAEQQREQEQTRNRTDQEQGSPSQDLKVPVPPTETLSPPSSTVHTRVEQAVPSNMAKAERATSHNPKAPSVADTMKLGAPAINPTRNQAARDQAAIPEPQRAPSYQPNPQRQSLDDLKAQAKERARSKNLGRKRDHNRDMKLNRNRALSKHRSRNYELGR